MGLDLTQTAHFEATTTVETWEEQAVSLKIAIENILTETNRLIQESSDQQSIQGQRYFKLQFPLYLNGQLITNYRNTQNEPLVPLILQALKEYIFKMDIDGYAYDIQA